MIASFGCRVTEEFWMTDRSRRLPSTILTVARRKLAQLDIAMRLADLRIPPGNRLEELAGSLSGFHSIRINDQWRVIFRWTPSGAEDVAIIDYH